MADPMPAHVQDVLAHEVLQAHVVPPQHLINAVEDDLLALGLGGRHPVGKGVEQAVWRSSAMSQVIHSMP